MKRYFVLQIALLSALVAVTFTGCTSNNDARKALDDLGFKDIQTGGYSVFGCGKEYSFHTKFTATNQNGKIVTGVVCSGWLIGTSVKFD
jgi:hypothetical protein